MQFSVTLNLFSHKQVWRMPILLVSWQYMGSYFAGYNLIHTRNTIFVFTTWIPNVAFDRKAWQNTSASPFLSKSNYLLNTKMLISWNKNISWVFVFFRTSLFIENSTRDELHDRTFQVYLSNTDLWYLGPNNMPLNYEYSLDFKLRHLIRTISII